MKFENIKLGKNVTIDPSTSFNNVHIKDNVKVAKRCSIFGSNDTILEIGESSYVGMNCTLNGFAAKVRIGSNVSIAQNVNLMSDSGPNASKLMQKIYPIEKGEITIGNHSWIGASVIIMPNVTLGEFCIVAANSYVNKSFPAYSIIGGTPAKLIKTLSKEQIEKLQK